MVGQVGLHPDRTCPRSPLAVGGANTQGLAVYVDDADVHCERARAAGAVITTEPATQDYGEGYWVDRSFEARDVIHDGPGEVVAVVAPRHLGEHGLSWPRRVRGLVLAAYCAGVLAVYGPLGWSRLSEVLRIPLIDYAAVFALVGIIGGVIGVLRLLGRSAPGGERRRAV